MAKWTAKPKQFAFHSSTAGSDQIKAAFDLDTGVGHFEQDLTHFVENAKKDRDEQDFKGFRKDGYRKFATIPDSIALKLLTDHGMDLHDPNFMGNPANMTKLKRIMLSEYRDLVINT